MGINEWLYTDARNASTILHGSGQNDPHRAQGTLRHTEGRSVAWRPAAWVLDPHRDVTGNCENNLALGGKRFGLLLSVPRKACELTLYKI